MIQKYEKRTATRNDCSTFFLTNFLLLAPIISQFGIIAIRQPHSAGQKMCKTHGIAGGGSDCRRKYSRASPKHADG